MSVSEFERVIPAAGDGGGGGDGGDADTLGGQAGSYYRSRSNHTGSQASSTISDFAEAARDVVGSALVAGDNTIITVNDGADTITIGAQGLPELIRDTIGTALVAGANMTITPNDAGDTITLDAVAGDITDQVQDIVGAFVSGTGGVAATYTDGSNTLVITIANGALALAKLANIANGRVLGNVSGSAAAPTELTAGDVKTFLALGAGDITGLAENVQDTVGAMTSGTGGITATYDDTAGTLVLTIANGALALSKLATQAAGTFIANTTGGTASPTAVTAAAALAALSGVATSAFSFGSQTVTVGTAAAGTDALNRTTGDARYVAKATMPVPIVVAASDETTALTSGAGKVTFRMPHAMTLTAVRASLTTASSSGVVTVDVNEAGTTILSTKLTIDANEKTSTTAATPAVISDTALADDAEITIDIDTAGTGAAGLKVALIGTRVAP